MTRHTEFTDAMTVADGLHTSDHVLNILGFEIQTHGDMRHLRRRRREEGKGE